MNPNKFGVKLCNKNIVLLQIRSILHPKGNVNPHLIGRGLRGKTKL